MTGKFRNAEIWSPGTIEHVPVASLRSNPLSARVHSKAQIRKLANAFSEFGVLVPIVVDANNMIAAGNARFEAAKSLGMATLPIIRADHLSETQLRAFMLADNHLGELSLWDPAKLSIELGFLLEVAFKVEITGFETPEIDAILAKSDSPSVAADGPTTDPTLPLVSRLGDLWLLNKRHALLCGNALEGVSYQALLKNSVAQMVFADPPFNVRVNGHVSSSKRHSEFAMASGEMSDTDYQQSFLAPVFELLAKHTTDGSMHFVCSDWGHLDPMLGAGRATYSELKNLCVWAKQNGGMGSLYRSQHELFFVWKAGTKPHINNVQLGRFGRNRTNIWSYPGANGFGPTRASDLEMHPTVKPVALVEDAILDCSKRNGIILDPFVGSGTTIIAADRSGRRAAGIEIDPVYVDTAIRRWQNLTGGTAVDAFSGLSFAQREEQAHAAASRDDHEPTRLSITKG